MLEILPSAELDALIAERVMGWVRREHPTALDPAMRWDWVDTDGKLQQYGYWSPSTEPYYAWQVITHLNQRDPSWRVQLTQVGYPPRAWRCIAFQGALSEGVTVQADTAMRAVCLAALQVVSPPA